MAGGLTGIVLACLLWSGCHGASAQDGRVRTAQAGGDRPVASAADAQAAMVSLLAAKVEALKDATGVASVDPRVLAAFGTVPRHRFLPDSLARYAYVDSPLPLGFGQNLTMPFLALLMTELLQVKPGDRVLEAGTDVGYQAAILAELGAEVFSVEIVAPLLGVARDRLAALGYQRVRLREGDGFYGWDQHAPYDAILLKESAPEPPPPIVRQLRPGGRLVMPLGPVSGQQLVRFVKRPDGSLKKTEYLPVRFSPFQGGERT